MKEQLVDKKREIQLEEALLEYIERYGPTPRALELFRKGEINDPGQTETGPDQRRGNPKTT